MTNPRPAGGPAWSRPEPPARAGSPAWVRRLVPVLVLLALMWATELVDQVTPLDLDRFGIRPRDVGHLQGIVLSPFLHLGWSHLLSNTVVLLVLGSLLALTTRHLWLVTVGVVLVGGLGVWLFGGPGSVHIGASGVVYGYAAFLAVYGFVARRIGQALVGLLVIAVYGSMLWGVLPVQAGVSWQAHLFGALAGVLLAILLGRRDRHTRRPERSRTPRP